MEIISYFDSNSSFAVQDIPLVQKPAARRPIAKPVVKAECIEVVTALTIRTRIVLIAMCAALLLSVAVVSLVLHGQSFAKPVDFNEGMLFEEQVLASSMHDFVGASSTADAFEVEALALLELSKNTVLYTEPVEFKNYTVKSGDSIHSISNKFGLSNISTLIGINDIENVRLLYVGETLKVPSVDGLLYTVKSGDTLDSIAVAYTTSIEEILDVNDLESASLVVGEDLFIPGAVLDSETLRLSMGELFVHPLRISYRVSSEYGYRADPFSGVRSFHTGTDFAVAKGTPVRSAMSGYVSTVGYSNIYGYYVIVEHGNGYQTLYAHFMSPAPVKKGQSVTQNTVVGYVGSTGYSTGNHLHLSVYKNGTLVSPRTIINY